MSATVSDMEKKMLTVTEVAQRLQVHENTVRNWITRGDLEATRVGPRMIRVDATALDTFMKRG